MDVNLFLNNHGIRTVPNPDYNPKSKKNNVPRTIDIVDLNADRNQLQEIVAQDLTNQTRVSAKEASKYEKYGINWNPKEAANGSLDVQLAEAQSNWAKFGNALAQTVVSEIGLGTMLGISDLFDAVGQAIGTSDHDYNNPVSAKLEEWQDKFNNEVAPIYSRPGSGFGNGTDFGWWMQNIPSIASSLTLLIPAAGATKALSVVGKGIVKGTKAGAKWAAKAARLNKVREAGRVVPLSSRAIETGKLFAKNATTSALSRTMENYQEARQVYNDMYTNVLDSLNNMTDEEYDTFLSRNPNTVKGADTSNRDEVAKAVAKKSSDMTFKMDYANTVFDIIQLYALRNVAFHGFRNSKVGAAARRLDKNSRRFAGKYNTIAELEELSSKQSIGRKITDKLDDILYSGRTVVAAEASEGVEEAVNYIAQQEGMEVGKSMLSMEANTTFSNRLKQYVKNPELWESAFWGVVGGVVFQGAGSGLARAKTALERKNEKKKNKPNEQTGEDVNANTSWKALWELPDVKRVKASIENRLATEDNYQKNAKRILDDNTLANEEKEILLQQLRNQRRTDLALKAMDSGTIDMLKGYLEDDNVKQALIDKGVVTKEQADEIQKEDIEAIQKVQDVYDDNVRTLNNISRNINAKNETIIPTEYLQIIARNNIESQLAIENYQKQLDAWSAEADDLHNTLDQNDKLDKNINYKDIIRVQWLTQKLGELEADKRELLKNKEVANSISGQEALRSLNNNINTVRQLVTEVNPDNKLENLLFAIENSFATEKTSNGYEFTGASKEYLEFRQAATDKNTKFFEDLDERLVGIEERHFGAQEVLNQNVINALGNKSTSIKNISQELGSAYATLAALQYQIATEKTNIKLSEQEVEDEAKHIHNYLNEVRYQKIKDSKVQLETLADTYGSDNIRNLVTQRYNGETVDYSNINMSDEDKTIFNEAFDTLNLTDKLNSNLAVDVDLMLATHDDVKAAQDANAKSHTIESSSTSQNPDLASQNSVLNNTSTDTQTGNSGQNSGQNGQNGQNTTQTQPQTSTQPTQPKPNASGLDISNIANGTNISFGGSYSYLATANPDEFKVDFKVSSKNLRHFSNPDLFTQEEGVDFVEENYIVGKKPIIDKDGNVIEKGTLVLKTEDNVAQADVNQQEDLQAQQESLASTGEVVNPISAPIPLEQLAGPIEQQPVKQSEDVAEIPYDENDITSQANGLMFGELQAAHAENREVNWSLFRENLNTRFQKLNTSSKYINEQIERVITKGKALAERKGIKSVDAVMDVMAKTSRIRENVPTDEDQKGFSESVNNLIDVFNSEVGIDVVGGKKYVNLEALCRYCDKVLNDKLSAGLLLNNLIDLAKKDKNLVITDSDTNKINEKLRNTISSVDTRNAYLGIDYNSVLRKTEASHNVEDIAKLYDAVDNLHSGDKLVVERGENGVMFKSKDVNIGSLPFPKVAKDGSLHQYNNGWNTDILFEGKENIKSNLMDLFITWATDITNPDIKELNDIILKNIDPKYEGSKEDLIRQFENNKEIKKAVANKFTVDTPNYEELLNGISNIWKYTRSNGNHFEGSILEARKDDITEWFRDKVAPSFALMDQLRNDPNLEVEVDTISEGEPIIVTRDKALPVSKAIGTNHKGQVRLGVVQKPSYITLAGNGIEGSNTLFWYSAETGNTFVVIPSRSGRHHYVQAYPQRVNSNSISKKAKDIKNAIYSEIRRICNDQNESQKDRAKALEVFLRQILPVYTKSTNKTQDTSSFFRRDIENNKQISIGTNFYNNAPNGYTVRIGSSYYNVLSNGSIKQGTNKPSIEALADIIINGIEENCNFNLSYSAFNSDLGFAERQNLTKRGKNGEFIVSIPNQQDFTFNSYNDFVLENDLVLLTTQPTPDGKSNFNRLGSSFATTQQITVKVSNTNTSPVEENVEETTNSAANIPAISNPREEEILEVLNNKRIKNKAEKLADLLFGKKLKKQFKFHNQIYKLFPKNIIFVDENIGDNAIVNTGDRPITSEEHNGLIIPAKSVVLGREWLDMASDSNELNRKQAVKKLIHEQLHILLSGENQKYIEQIREVFDEFAEKNNNPELNKYLFKEYEGDYYTDGKLNQAGLEEFLVETLTSNELAEALNNIETNSIEDKNKKESLFQKIMKLLAKILGIDIKEGSLYEKEFKLLRDILDTNVNDAKISEQETVISNEENSEAAQTTQTIQEEVKPDTPIENANTDDTLLNSMEEDFDATIDDMFDNSDAFDMFKKSTIRENVEKPIANITSEMQAIKDKAIANGTFMKAPNGNPTNLTEKQWLQVRTKSFKDWFSDWEHDSANASKVIDENGEPLVVYHGGSLVNVFDTTGKSGLGAGIVKGDKGSYFTSSLQAALQYENIFKDKVENSGILLNELQMMEMRGMSDEEIDKEYNSGSLLVLRGGTRSFFLNIRNPKNRYYSGIPGTKNSYTDSNVGNNDGQVITGKEIVGTEYVAFNPNQIKSATDNVGTFSKTNNDIRYSRIRENTTPSVSAYIYNFPLEEQAKIVDKIENGEISITCK